MFTDWQRTAARSREYDYRRAVRGQTIESWQLEDALNALKQNEIALAKIEHRHARETEQLHTTVAALEHTTKQRQSEVKGLQATLIEVQEKSQQQLATANLTINKLQALRLQETRQQATENGKLRGVLQANKRTIGLQATTLADLDHLCDRREVEILDSQRAIRAAQAELQQTKLAAQAAGTVFQSTIRKQQQQIQEQERLLVELRAREAEQDADLVEALRLCDDTEIKLTQATEQHGREVAKLQQTINSLTATARDHELRARQHASRAQQQESRAQQHKSRASELERERDELKQEQSIRLDDLQQQSEEKLAAAAQRYEAQFGTLQSKLASFESLADDRASQVQRLSSKMVQLKDEHTQELTTAQQTARALKQERDKLKEELSIRLSDLSQESEQKLAAAAQRYESQFGNLQSKLVSLESLAEERAAEVQQLNSRMVKLQQDYVQEVASAQQSATEVVSKVERSAAEAMQQAKQQAAAELEQAQKLANAAVEDAKRSADEALQKAEQQHQAEVKRLQSVMTSVEKAFEASIAEKRNIQAKAEVLERKCESLQQDAGQQAGRADQIKRLEESIRAGQERIKNQKVQQANRLKVELDQLRKRYAAAQAERARYKHEARRLASRLGKLLSEYGRERKRLQQRIVQLQSELQPHRSEPLAA